MTNSRQSFQSVAIKILNREKNAHVSRAPSVTGIYLDLKLCWECPFSTNSRLKSYINGYFKSYIIQSKIQFTKYPCKNFTKLFIVAWYYNFKIVNTELFRIMFDKASKQVGDKELNVYHYEKLSFCPLLRKLCLFFLYYYCIYIILVGSTWL